MRELACPFCATGVEEYDSEGLKHHLLHSCGAFTCTLSMEQPQPVEQERAITKEGE